MSACTADEPFGMLEEGSTVPAKKNHKKQKPMQRRQCPICKKACAPQGWDRHTAKHVREGDCGAKDIPDYKTLPIVKFKQAANAKKPKKAAGVRQPVSAAATTGRKVLPIQEILDYYSDDLAKHNITAEFSGRYIILRKGGFAVRGPAEQVITTGIASFATVAKLLPGNNKK